MSEPTFSPLIFFGGGSNLFHRSFSLQTGLGPVLQWIDKKSTNSYGFYAIPLYQFEKSRPQDIHRFGVAIGYSRTVFSPLVNFEFGFVPKKNFTDNTFEPGIRGSINFGHGINGGIFIDIPDLANIPQKGLVLGAQVYFNFLEGDMVGF